MGVRKRENEREGERERERERERKRQREKKKRGETFLKRQCDTLICIVQNILYMRETVSDAPRLVGQLINQQRRQKRSDRPDGRVSARFLGELVKRIKG